MNSISCQTYDLGAVFEIVGEKEMESEIYFSLLFKNNVFTQQHVIITVDKGNFVKKGIRFKENSRNTLLPKSPPSILLFLILYRISRGFIRRLLADDLVDYNQISM